MEMHHVNEESLSLSLIKELEPFFQRNGFLKTYDCLQYLLNNQSCTEEKQLIVRNNKKLIVGCNLFLKSRAHFLDHEEDIYWSHSTYLEPSYRASCGIKLMMKVEERENVFGFGLTDINEKLQHLIGNVFLSSSIAYLVQIPSSALNFSAGKDNCGIPEYFETAGRTWKRIRRSHELQYPNEGYWNKEKLSVDFVRDEDFIRRRFLNHYKEYYIYSQVQPKESVYFIWRYIHYNDSIAVYLVDYRFSIDNPAQMKGIVDALVYIALLNHIQRIFVFSTIGLPQPEYPTSIYGSPSLIVTNHIMSKDTTVFVTPADSDCELWLE